MTEHLQLAQFPNLPVDLAQACEQAIQATQLAIQAGYRRLLIEILAPEIKPEVLARPFLQLLQPPALVLFSDAGGAALAQREWGSLPEGVELQSLTARTQPTPEQSLLFVMPAVYNLDQVERVCQAVSSRDPKPVVLLNPQLQDAATVGVGLAGRRLRQRFLSTFETSYYLRSLAEGALFRAYPDPWSVWQQEESGLYSVLQTFRARPSGEEVAELFQARRKGTPWWSWRRWLGFL
ncbi:DUF1995 family protein [Synechococcus sp. R65.1]|uniref:DUF1995 family protein n=1 Tax=unclassified Synechococcus TaxID=2626047 RepID=UPI0039C139E0